VPLGQQRARLVGPDAVPGGTADHGVHDDLTPVHDARGVGAQHHRQLLGAQTHATQRPQVVVVERGGAHVHHRPVLARHGLGALPDLETRDGVVGRELTHPGRDHTVTLPTPARCGAVAWAGARPVR
jgi:hypothetical protein